MKNQERNRLLRIYGKFYSQHYYSRPPEIRGDCYYCGEFADTIEHVPPVSRIEERSIAEWKASGIDIFTVRCCSHCNSMLGAKRLLTIEERLAYIENQLTKKYERESKLWSASEIAEMSPEFRRTITARQNKKIQLLERIRNVQWRQQQLPIEFPENYE